MPLSDDELDTFTIAFQVNNTVKMCNVCQGQKDRWFPELKEIAVCEGCKHQIFNYPGIDADMVAPFHVNKVADFVAHTLETCLLVSKWNKVKNGHCLELATPTEIVGSDEINDDNRVLLQNRICA